MLAVFLWSWKAIGLEHVNTGGTSHACVCCVAGHSVLLELDTQLLDV